MDSEMKRILDAHPAVQVFYGRATHLGPNYYEVGVAWGKSLPSPWHGVSYAKMFSVYWYWRFDFHMGIER